MHTAMMGAKAKRARKKKAKKKAKGRAAKKRAKKRKRTRGFAASPFLLVVALVAAFVLALLPGCNTVGRALCDEAFQNPGLRLQLPVVEDMETRGTPLRSVTRTELLRAGWVVDEPRPRQPAVLRPDPGARHVEFPVAMPEDCLPPVRDARPPKPR